MFQDIVYKSSLPVYRFLRILGIFPYIRNEPGRAEFIVGSKIGLYAVIVFLLLLVSPRQFSQLRFLDQQTNLGYRGISDSSSFFSDLRFLHCSRSHWYHSVSRRTVRRISHCVFILVEYFTNRNYSHDMDRNTKIHWCFEQLDRVWGKNRGMRTFALISKNILKF